MIRPAISSSVPGEASHSNLYTVLARGAPEAPDAVTFSIFSSAMAAETSGFFREKVPPKPQHSSASGSGRRSMSARVEEARR